MIHLLLQAKGINSPSVVSKSLERLGRFYDKEAEGLIRGVSATIYGAGSDTVGIQTVTFLSY